ncbi:hypothetical protein KCP73_08750 [Salmonella enterica subsp. enterica]|nr:hypothetical protein KCP73_08750 [Salmonella enterica subsp. enterica]
MAAHAPLQCGAGACAAKRFIPQKIADRTPPARNLRHSWRSAGIRWTLLPNAVCLATDRMRRGSGNATCTLAASRCAAQLLLSR